MIKTLIISLVLLIPCSLFAEQLSTETMIDEIIISWNMSYDDQGIRYDHPLRTNFFKYAVCIVSHLKATNLYKYKDIHLIVAAMVMKESAVHPGVRGKRRNEVGLLQVHRTAQTGHTKKEISKDYDLGLYLGMRWLSKQIKYCRCFNGKHKDHFDKWLGVMTVYMAGVSKGRDGRKCKVFYGAKNRIRLARKYRKFIDRSLCV